jgi:hypothetical protein
MLGRLLVGLAAFATLIGLFYGVADWRGLRVWNPYRHGLERFGIPVDYSALWPKPIPDDQNFAATPEVRNWFDRPYAEDHKNRWNDPFSAAATDLLNLHSDSQHRIQYRHIDLPAWARAFAASPSNRSIDRSGAETGSADQKSRAAAAVEVLRGLNANAALFAELRTASRRSGVRYPLNYETDPPGTLPTPHLSDLPEVCARLQLKACAELATGNSDRALEDVTLILFLADTLKTEPLFFSQWTRVFLLPKAIQPIWEGLADGAWTLPQLDELMRLLRPLDFLGACQFAWNTERAGVLWTLDGLRNSEEPGWMLGGYDKDLHAMMWAQLTHWPDWLFRLMPSGWYAQEKLGYCELFNRYYRTGFEPAHHRISPAQIESNAAEANHLYNELKTQTPLQSVWNHCFAATTFVYTNHYAVLRRFGYVQATVDQAWIACALEMYRRTHGQYPDQIEALAPQYIPALPNDVILGKPYRYRRMPAGAFILYSIGWNEKDDDGTPALNKDGSLNLRNGDWAWAYSPPTAGAVDPDQPSRVQPER